VASFSPFWARCHAGKKFSKSNKINSTHYRNYDRLGERILLIIGIFLLAIGPVLLFPYGGPPPPIKYLNSSHSITSTIGADNDTLVQQLTLDYNYGWLSLTSMGPHDISGHYFYHLIV
jgi:hypothetical protein